MKVKPSCAACEVGAAGVAGTAAGVQSETGVVVPIAGDVLKTGLTQKFVAEAPLVGNPPAPYWYTPLGPFFPSATASSGGLRSAFVKDPLSAA